MINLQDAQLQQSGILIITGYSGAGKSTVLRALEDIGFFCIDNLPITLFNSFYQLHTSSSNAHQRIALGIDVRTGHTLESLAQEILYFKEKHQQQVTIIFLSSSSRVLMRRFQETRRKHPIGESMSLAQAIAYEKNILKPLKVAADLVLVTDGLSVHQLRNFVRTSFALNATYTMMVNVVSFGFKYGVPTESNFVYDVRSLPNPYFISKLKGLTGKDDAVKNYLFDQALVVEYWDNLSNFVRYSLEQSYQEGRFFIKIAIGCTGGRHRSVAFVEQLAQLPINNVQFLIEHRDINRDNYTLK
jgi:UPF0042 nucleotide-binding protein